MKQIARATIPLALLLAWPLSCAAADLPRGVGALTFPGEAGKCPAFREYSHDEKHGSCAVFY